MMDHLLANELFDLYGPLLSTRQQEVLELYFQDDLSLSEIRENLDISKAAVYDALNKGTAAMDSYEQKLHLYKKKQVLLAYLQKHPEAAELAILFEDPSSMDQTEES
ncbi:YlxM family DNA-binding protein [Allobaculum mucilyticum]|uniref:YlxM family DNA-binding protein n=1 Tax=Allobaculum mucilyticum TaxID=2834459 RepID=UPI001E42CF04|nr:sigma factor-like helix-turn-helix DNA-binding protein [Allobaculum mucilyticum]UNT95765.1 hypothetical protein KWG62_10715 [Allobaculum mucilyticum]